MLRVIECEQGTAEWLHARCGLVTASRMNDVLAYLKSGKGEMKCRADYRMDLVAERLTGLAEPSFVSAEMRWGTENEPLGRAAYELQTDALVELAGFALHSTLNCSGASPDGLVGTDGGLEIKCPKTTTHLQWMLDGKVPEEHQAQMLWNMVCWERDWWDFASYDPRLPANLRLFVVRLAFDGKRVAAMEDEVQKFNAEIDTVIHYFGEQAKRARDTRLHDASDNDTSKPRVAGSDRRSGNAGTVQQIGATSHA